MKTLKAGEEAAKHPARPVLASEVAGAGGPVTRGGTAESGRDGVQERAW